MAIVGGIVGGLAASAVTSSVLVAVGVGIAAAYSIDYAMDAMMEDVAVDTMGGRNVSSPNSSGSREIVYGKVRKGGNVLWQDVAGNNNKYLYQITALSHTECESIDKVFFDRDEAWANGVYNSNYWYLNELNVVKILVKTGSSSQTPISTVTSGTPTEVSYWNTQTINGIQSSHKLNNIAYVWTRFAHNPDKFPNGVPNVTAEIKGRKIYDPRVSNSDIDNPSTFVWTANPVLCLYDYMRNEDFGAGISASEFDESQISDAADHCDDLVGSPQKVRYECHGIVDTKNSFRQNIKNLLSSMNGRITYVSGKFRIEPFEYKTPHTQDLNEDIIIGDFTVIAKTPRQDNYNFVKGTYVSKEAGYIKTEYPQQKSTSYADDDGGEHVLNLDLPFTTDTINAQRLARLNLLKSRMQSRIKARLNAKGLTYCVGDNVNVSNAKFGIVDNVYEITSCTIGFDTSNGVYVDIEARENASEVYDHTASTDQVYTTGQVIDLPRTPTIAEIDSNTVNAFPAVRWNGTKFERGFDVVFNAVEGVKAREYIASVSRHNYTNPAGRPIFRSNVPTMFVPIPYSLQTYTSFSVHLKTASVFNATSDWVSLQFSNPVFPDFPSNEEHFLFVADAQVTPTESQWTSVKGAPPFSGDKLTLIEKDSAGNIIDAETYIFDADFSMGLAYVSELSLGDTADAVSSREIRIPKSVYSEHSVTLSVVSTNYVQGNTGYTVSNLPITIGSVVDGVDGAGLVPVEVTIPASVYNNFDDSTYDYAYYLAHITLQASYGNQTSNFDITVYDWIQQPT